MRRSILTLSVLFCASCGILEEETVCLTVLSDRTDPIIAKPDMATIEGFLELGKNPDRGVDFKFKVIGNVDFLPARSFELQSSSLMDNDFQRTADVRRFLNRMDTLLVQENQKEYTFQGSSIFHPLLDGLIWAKNSGASHKVVMLWSDLQEISDVYDVLDYNNRKKLVESPLAVANEFTSTVDIPNLEGVSLYIIHYPDTRERNRSFRAMCEVYKHIYKDSGLQIQIGTDQIPEPL